MTLVKLSEYHKSLLFVKLLVRVTVVISFKFYNTTALLHCRFRNDCWAPLINDSCSKFRNLSLNCWSTNILNGGTPPLIKVATPVSASNFKDDTAEIKECWV